MITSTEAFLAGLLAGYGVAIPVGAIVILIISLAARTSLRVGAAAALGVATGPPWTGSPSTPRRFC